MYLEVVVENKKKEPLTNVVFLRGGAVAVLIILRPSDSPDERYVVMTEQPRIPAGSLNFMEIPAGMLDPKDGNRFKGESDGRRMMRTATAPPRRKTTLLRAPFSYFQPLLLDT